MMSSNKLQNFIQNLEQIQLSDTERKRVRADLEEHIMANQPVRSPWQGILSPLQDIQVPAVVAALLFFMIGGVSLLAEDALPGDPLYAVKINVNERMMGIASLNDDVSEAENESRIASRRIAELEALAARGSLDPQVSNRLTTAISQHTQLAREHIKAASDAGEVSSALSLETELISTLNTHGDILEQLGIRNDGSFATTTVAAATELRSMAETKAEEDVSTAVTNGARSLQVRTDEEKSISPVQANQLLARTADRLEKVRRTFEKKYDSFSDETVRDNLEQLLLKSANEIDVAVDSLDASEHEAVKSALQKALTYAHEASIIINVHESFDLSSSSDESDTDDSTATTSQDTSTSTVGESKSSATSSAVEDATDDSKDGIASATGTRSNADNNATDVSTSTTPATSTATTSTSTNTSTSTGTSTGAAEEGVNMKRIWSPDSEAYTRINEVLDRVEKTLSEDVEELNSGMLPGRSTLDEEK